MNGFREKIINFMVIISVILIGLGCDSKESESKQDSTEFKYYEDIPETAKGIKENPESTKKIEDKVLNEMSRMDENDLKVFMKIKEKAISLLPETAREQLIILHDKTFKHGQNSLTKEELILMETLNKKAIDLLPEEEKRRFESIAQKILQKAYE
jgi:hypothetical protein